MITLRVDADTVARVRFSFSPANEVMSWLKIAATGRRHPVFGDPGPSARSALTHPDVALLAGLIPPSGATYVPDFVTPQPGRATRPAELLDEQIAAVEATGQDVLEFQLGEAIDLTWGRCAPVPIRRALESGTMPKRLASGLFRLWTHSLAEVWPTLQSVIDQDIAARVTTLRTHGLARLLNTAHPKLTWTGGAIVLDSAFTGEHDFSGRDLVLAPSVLSWPDLLVQGPDDAVLYLPPHQVGTGSPRHGRDLGAVIGDARALLLAELEQARSTTDLARRLGYTPGTISYHLSAMHRVGLVTKHRDGRYVLYKRTPQSCALLPD
ncbi:helix-turn-helix domain-containing protein [Lentzea sp. BCCO 10_0856]|uniref:Helix-turn-helix domain-containing protein n=1 Tax=Lentzea miocenica TaxID=3095431 RepID=A0ABU4SXC2_9PSEU|nr:ArsR family transcriptional regulator [Lentzea sp. BCCO 10_0856]MDX8030432.1 helix-turn-helix domain-containing protein [Lentzea sp. BCCO 10_0856]